MDSAGEREKILRYLQSQRDRIREQYHLRKVALIGSFARNEQTEESDIDLIVEFDPGTNHIYTLKREFAQEMEHQFHRRVDIASERYLKPYYRDSILREAVYV